MSKEFTPTPHTHIRRDKSGELWKMQHVPGCEWIKGECNCGANAINEQIEVLVKQVEDLESRQFPLAPMCGTCGKPRKPLGVMWETHIH